MSPTIVPSGAPNTGGGGTSGGTDVALFAVGGASMLVGGGTFAYRRITVRGH
jgi:hypothetical protein